MAPRLRFRPELRTTAATIPAFAILIGLGVWQLDRLAWKTALIETFETRVAAAPAPPPAAIGDIEEWQFRRLRLEGEFLHDKEVQVTGKPFEGTAGFHVVAPLLLADGRTVLVNRGWVPESRRLPESRRETLVPGPVAVEGILREDRRRGYFVPDNEPEGEVWLYIDTAEIAARRGLGPVAPYYVDALRPPGPYTLPIGASDRIAVRNEHLQYAMTWFLLAAALAGVYIAYHLRREGPEDGPE